MCRFSEASKNKLGNAIIFIAERAKYPYKTEVLKLLFLMEEQMVLRYHTPLLAIPYSVWRMGPMSVDVFEELSDGPQLLDQFIELQFTSIGNKVIAKQPFCDDEFSDAEITIMEQVMQRYGQMSSDQLIAKARSGTPRHRKMDSLTTSNTSAPTPRMSFSTSAESSVLMHVPSTKRTSPSARQQTPFVHNPHQSPCTKKASYSVSIPSFSKTATHPSPNSSSSYVTWARRL